MTDESTAAELAKVRESAHCLATPEQVNQAMDAMAIAITEKLSQTFPLLLGVMNGGVVPMSMLLERLTFPLQVDYVHVTRYGMRTSGGELRWVRKPPESVAGRTVLIIDDLLDHGITLQAVVDDCARLGAAEVQTAVLVTKTVDNRAGLPTTDFSGLTLPDRYLFGYGMDYKSWFRNAPGIFAAD